MSGAAIRIHPGRLLAEPGADARWRVAEPIAQGRSFDLWLVDDLHLEGHHAVAKLIRYTEKGAAHRKARQALLDQERDLYVLPATMIPEPLDWLTIEDEPILFYEYQLGDTVESLIKDRFPTGLGEQRALRICRELALFAAETHEAGFVLRGICPEHVLVGLDDVLQIVGLGNATRAGVLTPDQSTKQSISEGFSAPELGAASRVDPIADSFSLGAMLVFLATGQLSGGLSSGRLADLAASCMAADPRSRPTARRVYDALRAESERGRQRKAQVAPAAAPPQPAVSQRRPEPAPRERPAPEKQAPKKAAKKQDKKTSGSRTWLWLLLTLAIAGGVAAAILYFWK